MGNKNSIINLETQYPVVEYSQVKSQIQPFDVLLFRGKDFISSTISKVQKARLGNGEFTHAGIVINGDLLGFEDKEKLYCWEITMSGKMNDGVTDIRGKSFLGVQLRDLDKVIEANKGNVAWLKIKNNPYKVNIDVVDVVGENAPDIIIEEKEVRLDTPKLNINFNEILRRKVIKLFTETLETPYEVYCCNLLSATFPKLRCISIKSTKRFFCSEFVAYILKEVGILPTTIVESNVVPVDFIPNVDEDKEINCCDNPQYLKCE